MNLGKVDLLGRDARHSVSSLGGHLRCGKGSKGFPFSEAQGTGSLTDSRDPEVGPLRSQQNRRRSVGDGRAIVKPQRSGDELAREVLFLGDRLLKLGVRVFGAVRVVFDRDAAEDALQTAVGKAIFSTISLGDHRRQSRHRCAALPFLAIDHLGEDSRGGARGQMGHFFPA